MPKVDAKHIESCCDCPASYERKGDNFWGCEFKSGIRISEDDFSLNIIPDNCPLRDTSILLTLKN